jgi:hypothetical protein
LALKSAKTALISGPVLNTKNNLYLMDISCYNYVQDCFDNLPMETIQMKNLIFVWFCLILAISANAAEPNLVAHWKFDEGSGGTAYDSAGDNDGTIYGATWTTGQIDGALDFDGSNDYVDVADSASLSFTNPGLTITARVYLNQDQSGPRAILRKNNQWQLGIYPADNTIRNLVKTDGTNGWTAANDESYTINTDT